MDDELPDITEIKQAIPKECFQPSLMLSFYYCVKDIISIIFLYAFFRTFESYTLLLLPLYCVLQGTLMWSLFVVGHDCGHESFSNSSLINHVTGVICHSIILVPFYPWKLSHHWHHRNTCNIDKDEIFYPYRRPSDDTAEYSTIPYFGLGIGWALYLIIGYDKKKSFCHWNPFDSRFQGFQAKCLLSVVSCSLVGYLLYKYSQVDGYWRLVAYYGIPWMIFASWIVITTFLHHTDTDLTWYSNDRWTFVKGALSSVDRHYGLVHDMVHNIGTHQVHHLFTKIPHYNLEKATSHFRARYPHLVKVNNEPIWKAFNKMFHIYVSQYIIGEKTAELKYS